MHKLLEKLDKEIHKYADKEGELTGTEWKCVYEALEARYYLLVGMGMTGEDPSGNYSNRMGGYSDRWPADYSMNDYSDRSRLRGGSRGYSNNYSGTYPQNNYPPNDSTQMRQQLQNMMERIDAMDRR